MRGLPLVIQCLPCKTFYARQKHTLPALKQPSNATIKVSLVIVKKVAFIDLNSSISSI
jgi:hypothetical protein